METSKLVPAIACIGVLIPVALFARMMEPVFRGCIRDTVDHYQSSIIDSQRQYNREFEDALEQRKQGYIDSWNREDDKDQRDIERQADKRYSDRMSEIRNAQRDRDREASTIFNDNQRRCSQESSSRSSASRDSSRSASFASRSSSSFSSSSSRCNDIICPDGRRFPTCTNGGPVIDYYQNPCNPQSPPPVSPSWCFHNFNCSPGYRCDMGYGWCQRPCTDPREFCASTCVGRCTLNPL